MTESSLSDAETAADTAHTHDIPVAAALNTKFVAAFLLAYFGFWVTYLTPPIVSMSLRLATVLPEGQRAGALSLVLGVGGIVSVLTNPIVGALSDRTTSRFGMRVPWIVGGTVVAVIGLTLSALAGSLPGIMGGYLIAVAGVNAVVAALIALIPDQVPAELRGRISGLAGMCTPVGAVVGAMLVPLLGHVGPVAVFLVPAAFLVIGVVFLVVTIDDRKLTPEAAADIPRLSPARIIGSYWMSPRKHPDFAWTWLSRFLLFMGSASLVTFQVLYLLNQLSYTIAQVAGIVALSTLVHYFFTFAISPVAGWLSDKLGRRKVFVAAGAVIYAIGLVFVAVAHSLPLFLIGMAITGLGEGIYVAVDLALMADVLPDRNDAARAMGLFTVANTLPPALAPAIAPLFLAVPALGFFTVGPDGNFVALFLSSAVFALLGALAIRRVRATR
ncbi:MFS transporter [Gordonia sp. NPDC003424]